MKYIGITRTELYPYFDLTTEDQFFFKEAELHGQISEGLYGDWVEVMKNFDRVQSELRDIYYQYKDHLNENKDREDRTQGNTCSSCSKEI